MIDENSQYGMIHFINDFEEMECNVEHFVTGRLLSGVPSIWSSETSYAKWRNRVAEDLNVEAAEVHVVGSARLGYSLSPEKDFKAFDDDSDLDIAVVSDEMFEIAWRDLRSIASKPNLSGELKERLGYIRKLIFDQCIPMDIVSPWISFGDNWSKAADTFMTDVADHIANREIAYRIYRKSSALREYQAKSVRQAESRAFTEESRSASE